MVKVKVDPDANEYERQRLANIEKNKLLLKFLAPFQASAYDIEKSACRVLTSDLSLKNGPLQNQLRRRKK
jgi:hypothetical protein